MIKISIIVNDNLYKKIVGSSLNFTSVLGATEILNNHSDIFSIVQPGIINIIINHFINFIYISSLLKIF